MVVVRDLCRSEETGVYVLTRFLVVYELRAGECPVCCPHVVVSEPFVLRHPIVFEPSGFVGVAPVIGHVRVFRRGHVTLLV